MKILILFLMAISVSFGANEYDLSNVQKTPMHTVKKDGTLRGYDNWIGKNYFGKEVKGKLSDFSFNIHKNEFGYLISGSKKTLKDKIVAKSVYVLNNTGTIMSTSIVELVPFKRVRELRLPSEYDYIGSINWDKTQNGTIVEKYITPNKNYLFIVKNLKKDVQKFTFISKEYLKEVTQDFINTIK